VEHTVKWISIFILYSVIFLFMWTSITLIKYFAFHLTFKHINHNKCLKSNKTVQKYKARKLPKAILLIEIENELIA